MDWFKQLTDWLSGKNKKEEKKPQQPTPPQQQQAPKMLGSNFNTGLSTPGVTPQVAKPPVVQTPKPQQFVDVNAQRQQQSKPPEAPKPVEQPKPQAPQQPAPKQQAVAPAPQQNQPQKPAPFKTGAESLIVPQFKPENVQKTVQANQAAVDKKKQDQQAIVNRQKEVASFIDKQYAAPDNSVISGRDIKTTTFKNDKGEVKSYGNLLDEFNAKNRLDQDNFIKELDAIVRNNRRDFGDKATADKRDEASLLKAVLEHKGQLKPIDPVSVAVGFGKDIIDTGKKDIEGFGQVTRQTLSTLTGHDQAQEDADFLDKQMAEGKISKTDYAEKMNAMYNANESVVGDGKDKGALDRALRLAGVVANTVGSVVPLRSLETGLVKGAASTGLKEVAKDYGKEFADNAAMSAVGAFQEKGIDTTAQDIGDQALVGGTFGAASRAAGDVVNAGVNKVKEVLSSEQVPNPVRQASDTQVSETPRAQPVDNRVSTEAPRTPEQRTAAIDSGVITPETKTLPIGERLATAMNHRSALEANTVNQQTIPSASIATTEQPTLQTTDVSMPDQPQATFSAMGNLPVDTVDMPRLAIPDDLAALPPVPESLSAQPAFRNDLQPTSQVLDQPPVIQPRTEAEIRSLSQQMFGEDRVNFPTKLRSETGQPLFGKYEGGVIDIRADQADPRTTYFHEAVHKAIAEYTTLPERNVLFDDVRAKYGDERLLQEAANNGYSRGLIEAVEERIANDFIDFAAARSDGASLPQRVRAIFTDLIERIKRAFGQGSVSRQFMDDLFGGRFATQQPNIHRQPPELHPAARELDDQYHGMQARYDAIEDAAARNFLSQAMAANRQERSRIDNDNDARFRIEDTKEPKIPDEGVVRDVSENEFDEMINDAYRRNEQTGLEEGRAEAQKRFEQVEADPAVQKQREKEDRIRKVSEVIERGFSEGPRHKVEKIIDSAAELGFVPRKQVEEMVRKHADENNYDISSGRAFKHEKSKVEGLADDNGKIKSVDEIKPSDEVMKRINRTGIKNAVPYGESDPSDMVRQMVYKHEDGTPGVYFEYRTPNGKWQKSGLDAVAVKSPKSAVKLTQVKGDAAVNAEAKRAYDTGTTAQYIWRENDAGVNSEFVREFDAAMGDSTKLDKVDSNKIVSFDPDKHYIEAGKVVDSETGKILGNYIEITPKGVNMFAGRQRISLDYDDLDFAAIREMKTSGITWTTEGVIDRMTGNLKHTNTVDYFKKGGSRTKEALMHVMVDEPRAAARNIMDEDNALGSAVNEWEKSFNKSVRSSKLAEARRDAVYVIEPAADSKANAGSFEDRLGEFASNYGQKAADHLKKYDEFMRGVYDNLLVRMNKERVAIGQPEIKRRNNYITHIGEMADNGILRQSIQGINNMIGGDVMTDSRGALPASITGTTGTRKPKSKYNPFSAERLADNKPLNPFDPLRVYSNLALQNIHMTKAITMNRSIETTVRGLSEAKQEMSSSRGIQYVSELLADVAAKAKNGKATQEDFQTLSRKLFGLTRVFKDIEGVDGMQRLLRKAAKNTEALNENDLAVLDNATVNLTDQLENRIKDVDSLNEMKKEADALQQFVGFVQEHTNRLAGKTNWLIRGLKDLEKGKGTDLGLTIAKAAQQHGAISSIVGNASSALNQLLATPLVMGTTRPDYQLKGLAIMHDKSLMKKSDALWLRYKDSALIKKSGFQKAMNIGGLPLLVIEKNVMKWTFASKYAEGLGRGLDERQAAKYAERFIGDTTSWRDVASAPRAYDRPIPASLLQFTREVTQQYRGFWNRFSAKEKAGALIATMVVANTLALFTGSKAGADPLGAAIETGADIAGLNDANRTEEENSPWAKAVRAGQNILSEVVSAVPMASAAANTIWSKDDRAKIFGEDSNLGRYEGNMAMFTALGNLVRGTNNLTNGNTDQAWKDFVRTLPMGSQLQKTASGLQAMFQGYTTTTTGKVRTTVDQSNAANWVLAALFGTNAISEQKQSFANDETGLSEKQNEWFKKLVEDAKPQEAKSYLDSIMNQRKEAQQSKSDGKGNVDLAYDDDSRVKFAEGKWKVENGKVVDEDGEIATTFYKERAELNKDKQSDETYQDFMTGYGLIKEAETSNTGNSTLDKLGNLDNAKKAADRAGDSVSLFLNSKEEYKKVPDWVKDRFYKESGFEKKDVEYAASATYSIDAKVEGYFKPLAGDHQKLLDELMRGRVKSIKGQYFATAGVIDKLYDEGLLSKDERKVLKAAELNKDGSQREDSKSSKAAKRSGGKKGKASLGYTGADIKRAIGNTSHYSTIANILSATKKSTSFSGKVAKPSVQLRGLRAIVKSKQSTKKRRLA